MSKVVGFVLGAIEIGIGIVTGNVALIVSGAMLIAASTANLLLAPKTPAREAQEMTLQLGEQPRSIVVGEAAVAGSLVDGFNYGGKYGTDWEVLVIRLADERCHSLTGFYVDDAYVPFAGDGAVAGYNGQLEVYFRGDTTNDALPAVLTAHGPGWTADDIGESGSDVVVAYKSDDPEAKNPVWPGGRPRFLWVLKGGFRYDPRLDDTVAGGAGDHRWADSSTWEWSDNPIVCRYNWARGIYANGDVTDPAGLLVGRGLSASEAPPENVFAGANLCDETVEGEKRYLVDGPIYANQEYLEVEEMFAAACAGNIVTREGSVEVEPGHAKSSSFHFTDDDILVGSTVDWNHSILSDADESWVNSVVANYVEPSQQWQAHDAPVRRDTDDIVEDGKPREATLTLRLVKRAAQAQRCAEIARRLGRLPGRGGVSLGPRFAEVEDGDWGTWTSQRRFGGATKTFRVEAYQIDGKWQNRLKLREIVSSAFSEGAFIEDESTADQPDAPGDIGEPDGGAWAFTAEQLTIVGGSVPVLAFAGAVDDASAQLVRFEYWLDDGVTDPDDVEDWTTAGYGGPTTTHWQVATVAPGGGYYGAISYLVDGVPGDRLILGPVTAGEIVAGTFVGAGDLALEDYVYLGGGNVRAANQINDLTETGTYGVRNTGLSIASNGALSGGGGGQVTFGGLGGGTVGLQNGLSLGGPYLFDVSGLNALTETGTYGVRNTGLSIASNGALSGGGGGQVTFGGLGGGNVGLQNTLLLGGTYLRDSGGTNVLTETGTYGLRNSGLSISAAGALSGGGGGQVTFGGLGGGTVGTLSTFDFANTSYSTGLLPTGRAAAALINANVSIASNGALSGGGGGQVTFGGLGGGNVGLQNGLSLGGPYLFDVSGLNALTETGTYGVRNTGLSIASNGALSGGGGGQVTFGGLGGGNVGLQNTLLLGGTYLRDSGGTNVLTETGTYGLRNSGLSISAAGALSGGGGGQVTFGGLGGGNVGLQNTLLLGGTYLRDAGGSNVLTETGTYGLRNSGLSIASNGALSGGGGGQVTLPGLGAGSVAYGNAVGGGNLLRNSSFETDTNADGWAAGFNAYTNDANLITPSLVTGRLGGLAQRMAWAANTSTKGLYLANLDGTNNENLWKANQAYIWSFYAKASGAAVGTILQANWNHVPGSQTWITNPALSANWQRYSVAINFGAGTLDVNGFISVASTTANGVSTLDIDDMQIEEGDTATGYAPRANELLPGVVTYDYLSTTAVRLGINVVAADGSTSMGDAQLRNNYLSIASNGALSGGGGGQVTFGGLGGGNVGLQNTLLLGGTYLRDSGGANVLTETGTYGLRNSGLSISAAGALSGGGGGQVTLTGIAPNVDPYSTRADSVVRNGDFAEGATGYLLGSAASYAALGANIAPYGIAFANGGAQANSYAYVNGGNKVPYTARAAYFSAEYYGNNVATSFAMNIDCYDSGNNYISSTGANITTNATTTFAAKEVGVTLAAGTAQIVAYVARVGVGAANQYVTNLRVAPTQRGATLGATWGTDVSSRPANLAALSGSEGINNGSISLSAGGALSGAGGGQVLYDSLADGSTYAKVAASELSTGVPKLSVAGSGKRLADPRNLPAIAAMNLGYRFTGAVTYTAAAGTPATATISVAAGSSLIGTNSVSYSAMSVGVTGTGGTTVSYYLYVDDATFAGGAQTLVATTNRDTVYSSDARVFIGYVDVTFPTSGTGGGGGGGGGGQCVSSGAFVETDDRGFVRAAEIVEGDWIRVLSADRETTCWATVESNGLAPARGWRITSASGIAVTLSESTPIALRDGSLIRVVDIDGHELPVFDARLAWEACWAEFVGNIEVAHIRVGQRTYAAGDVVGRSILTHNPKP